MLKRKEELELQLHLEKDRGQQKLEIMRKNIHDLGVESGQISKEIDWEKKEIMRYKEMAASFGVENTGYEKLKEDDRKFFSLNLERLKMEQTPVDQLQSIDSNDDLFGVISEKPINSGRSPSPHKKK